MSQDNCARVHIALIELQREVRKGLLPTEPERLVSALRSKDRLSVSLTNDDRLLVATHLEACPSCMEFCSEQRRLGELLEEAGFVLPPQATDVELARLEQRLLASAEAGQRPAAPEARQQSSESGLIVRFKHYWSEKREVPVSSKYQTKKFVLVAACAFVVVLGVLYFSYFVPPVNNEDVQGAIGKRDVYRETNVTEKDVTASSGPGGVSYAGLVELLKSPEFKSLANSSNYQAMTKNDAAFNELVQNAAFQALCNQVQNNQVSGLISTVNGMISNGLAQNRAFAELFKNQQFQQAVASNASYHELIKSANYANLTSNSAIKDLLQNQQFSELMKNNAFYSFVHQNAQSMSDLSSMVQNAAYHEMSGNANALQELIKNSAFNSLIHNQSFGFLNLVHGLQGNPGFNNLATNSNFLGLIKDANFSNMAGNQAFQGLIKDSQFHQLVMNQQQDLANSNQFKELLKDANYRELAANNHFQELLQNSNFNNLLKDANFQNLIKDNQFQQLICNTQLPLYAGSAAGMQGLMQQSQQMYSMIQ